MKKLLAAVLMAGVLSSPLHAASKTIIKNGPDFKNSVFSWELTEPEDVRYFSNFTSEPWKVRVFANEYAKGETADKVSFTCNGEVFYLNLGGWSECNINPGAEAYFTIVNENFRHGADGIVEMF